jgi:small nuclear ribonucleoprotein
MSVIYLLLKAAKDTFGTLLQSVAIVMFLSHLQRLAQMSCGLGHKTVFCVGEFMNASKPMELLQTSIGAQVLVELKGRKKIKGKLRGYDQHLNLILEDAEEISIDPETNEQTVVQVETVIVRGDNVILVSPPPK